MKFIFIHNIIFKKISMILKYLLKTKYIWKTLKIILKSCYFLFKYHGIFWKGYLQKILTSNKISMMKCIYHKMKLHHLIYNFKKQNQLHLTNYIILIFSSYILCKSLSLLFTAIIIYNIKPNKFINIWIAVIIKDK